MRKTVLLKNPPVIRACAAVGGREEGRGPLGSRFDLLGEDDRFGMKTFELAEGEMGRLALGLALKKAGITRHALGLLVAGDLQNQCVASSGGLYTFGAPYLGLYGACSTCAESLLVLSTMLSENPAFGFGAAVTGSHNAAAERQFRLPLEYGGQRPPTAQWTATAAGAFILAAENPDPEKPAVRLTEFLPGKIIDGAISDAANMGAAMAPAAKDTIEAWFSTGSATPCEFDAIVTGDLGRIGSEILEEMLEEDGFAEAAKRHLDCGNLLYAKEQDTHAGGSGCGCSASVLATEFLPGLAGGKYKNILFLSTGALMSPTSVQQGEHIFGIAPAVRLTLSS